MTSAVRGHALSSVLLALVLAVSGCSSTTEEPDSGASSRQPQARPPSEICGGVLGASGAAALAKGRGSELFDDVDRDDMRELPLPQAAESLSTEAAPNAGNGKSTYLCLARTRDQFAVGSFDISAKWRRLKPGDEERASSKTRSAYDLAEKTGQSRFVPYASASAASGTVMFSCPVAAGREEGVVLALDMMSFLLAQSGTEDKAPELLVRVIHPVAVKLATDIGCLEESRLPRTLGELNPLPLAK
ncbi:hypothetical protein [Streptomyces lunaelactis]|uniref:hypothetical protein n=1 Tax=Streptomyces lunaelactis TaxID=1535768 RepID=UPI00158458E3|nr:hypothetical protein [Streptomyces lunaelactis]NUL09555.1 hypothetical protein [Streptomyces lunaelactis]